MKELQQDVINLYSFLLHRFGGTWYMILQKNLITVTGFVKTRRIVKMYNTAFNLILHIHMQTKYFQL